VTAFDWLIEKMAPSRARESDPARRFCAQRANWVMNGSVSQNDARFLFDAATQARVSHVVELGTGSGFTSGLLCHALHLNYRSGNIGPDFHIVTYDASEMWYDDLKRRVGDAAREQLPPALLRRITFRNPAMALDIARDYAADSIEFLFIDANHRHPWPAMDLFALLNALRPGATVVMHDINLPLVHPQFQEWGPKYLFDGLQTTKDVPNDGEVANIGRLVIPEDKARLKAQILEVLLRHKWEEDPRVTCRPDYLEEIGITIKDVTARQPYSESDSHG
jgi:predicted O-methyltransferase YrrM